MAIDLSGLWATVIHSAEGPTQVSGLWATFVHSAEGPSQVSGLWSTYQHTGILPSVVCPDITGTVGTPATFDGSASESYEYLLWAWTSVPGGSSIANAPIPLADNGSSPAGGISMANNQGLYHFEGNADDSSGNGRNGTISNAVQVAGKVGSSAYQFNGSATTYITLGATTDYHYSTQSFTIMAWYKPSAVQAHFAPLFSTLSDASGLDGYWIDQVSTTTNSYRWGIIPPGGSYTYGSAFSLTANVWSHVVAVKDGAIYRVYVNGVLQTSDTINATIEQAGNGSPLTLGRHGLAYSSSPLPWSGEIDEVAIFDRALTANEIQAIYETQTGNYAGTGTTLTFTPDVVGTYTVQLTSQALYDFPDPSPITADAVITAGGGTKVAIFSGASLLDESSFTGGSIQGNIFSIGFDE